MAAIRIFSYIPNPRVWKAQIAAEICGVQLEVVGDKPKELGNWLWDIEPRKLNEEEKENNPNSRTSKRGFAGELYKTDAFLQQHPFGTVPAAFDLASRSGIFESNSILRAVARKGAKKNSTLWI